MIAAILSSDCSPATELMQDVYKRQGIWLDAEKLGPDDTIEEVLKHGTLTVGFIGLAAVSYTHLDVYKRQALKTIRLPSG